MLRRSLSLVATLALAVGCASNPAKRQKIIDDEVARLRAPEVPLATFGSFEILPIAMSADVAEKTEKAAVATRLGEQLRGRLEPTVQAWAAAAPADARGRKLTIQATVVSLRVVSGGARFWLGAMAGDSNIDAELTLVDAQTGRAIAKERIAKSAGGMSGAWSMGSTDANLVGYVVDIASQYLLVHHK